MVQFSNLKLHRPVKSPGFLIRWFDRQKMSESLSIMVTALAVGIGAGLGAVLFRWMIVSFQTLFFVRLAGWMQGIQPYHLIILPALGGLIFGPLIYKYAREAKGHGVPEIMESVAIRGGRIRPQVAVVKSLASALCIGSGGSVGREGPIAQIGAALGSTIGQVLHLSDERIRNLVACGAAGGIAATFNAPIAGSLFALEVILGQMHAVYFGAVVISAVTADIITQFFVGNEIAFSVPQYTLVSPWELIFYAFLGGVIGLVSVGFSRLLYFSEDLWNSLRFKEYFKPVLGGALIGLIGLISPAVDGFPRIFGVGYNSITDALFGNLTIQLTFVLLILKVLATVTTLGSGGSGGVFAPSLFMGAMIGGIFGQFFHQFFPAITAPTGAYAMVGMAAFFSGAAHAPMTAILILFEMTGDYRIILPLMLAVVVSTIISQAVSEESIYTLKLSRRGVHLRSGKDIDVMQTVTVGEAMSPVFETVLLGMPLDDLQRRFESSHHHGFPVLDKEGRLAGVVTLQDLDRAVEAGSLQGKTTAEIATTENLLLAYEDEPMWTALQKLGIRDIGRLPVVKRGDDRRLIGVIRRKDIIQAYNMAIVKRSRHQYHAKVAHLDELIDAEFLHIRIPAGAAVIGRQIKDLTLPEDSLIVSVHRGRKFFIAHGYTEILQNDELTVITREEYIPEVSELLTSRAGG